MRIFSYFKQKSQTKDPIKFARSLGVSIGDNCKILGDPRAIFGSEPYLVTLGNHVEITSTVTFITHDGGVWTLRGEFPEVDVFGRIKVGNNVFVGVMSTILPGVTIGDNVVIGAGSIVTKDIPSNSVAAGVPARVIKSFQEYKESSLQKSLNTKNMTSIEKQEYLRKEKPEWF